MLSNYVKKLYHLFLELRKQFLSQIFIFPWFDNFFSFFYEFFHLTQRNWCIWFHEKKIVYLIPFHKTEFSNSFCQRFFDSPFIFFVYEIKWIDSTVIPWIVCILGDTTFRTIQNQHYSRLLLSSNWDTPLFKEPFLGYLRLITH